MTEQEALDAIAGKLEVSVFFMDSVPVRRVRRVVKGEPPSFFCSALSGGKSLTIDTTMLRLARGEYSIVRFSDGSTPPLVVAELSKIAQRPGPDGLGLLPIFIEAQDGERYVLCPTVEDDFSLRVYPFAIGFPRSASLSINRRPRGKETNSEKLKRERYEMCERAGLDMPSNPAMQLPRGIGNVADRAGVTRQTFSASVKAHIQLLAKRSRK